MADLITNNDKSNSAGAVVNDSVRKPQYVAWGTSSGQTATSTSLATAAAPTATTAVTGTVTNVTTTVTNDTVQTVGTVTAGGTLAITEAGTFTDATLANGKMCQYSSFSVINLLNGDSITFTFKKSYS